MAKTKDGGAKGAAIVRYVEEHGPSKRAAVAEAVGCTVGRVAEVARFRGWTDHGDGRWGPAAAKRRSRKAAS
jgi:hypothetical protein